MLIRCLSGAYFVLNMWAPTPVKEALCLLKSADLDMWVVKLSFTHSGPWVLDFQ